MSESIVSNGEAEIVGNTTTGEFVLDVSVVITTRNRAGLLEPTLTTLAAQLTRDIKWELIVVDNGSTDNTPAVVASAEGHLPIRTFRFEAAGKCRAQNFALEQVRGALVVFTDDDVSCDPGWLSALVHAARRWPDADLFGGAIRVRLIGEVPNWLADEAGHEIVKRHCAHYKPREDEGYTEIAPIGPNMAVRRAALRGVGFDENVGPDGTTDYIKGGDTDLNNLLMARGHRCVFVPNAIVNHHAYAHQLSIESLFEGAFRRGRKNAYLQFLKANVPVIQLLAERQSVWRRWFKYRRARRSGELAVYEAGMRYHYKRGYLYQAIRQRKSGFA